VAKVEPVELESVVKLEVLESVVDLEVVFAQLLHGA
jgi:hypothetical protein